MHLFAPSDFRTRQTMPTAPIAAPSTLATRLVAACTLSAEQAAGFVNRLRSPRPDRSRQPTAWKTLAVLVLVTLIPRLLMAWRIPTICVDGALFVSLAEACERGDISAASPYGFNLYPPILAGLHGLGISWDYAGEMWGVLCGTLVVLPLFGWVRRQFDDRVAVVSSLLYAVHPELIEWSPEMVRDQTFWLLFATSLYVMWRAVVEVRLRYFALLGLLMPMTAMSRFEGAFLIVPLLWWSYARFRALDTGRMRLPTGLVLTAGVPLVLVVAAAISVGKQSSLGDLLCGQSVRRVELWLNHQGDQPTAPTLVTLQGRAKFSDNRLSVVRVWSFVRIVERGLTPLHGLLMFGGLLMYYRLFLRSDHFPTILYGLFVCTGIWIHLWHVGDASSRYSLSIAMMGCRAGALCLMRLNGMVVDAWTRVAANSETGATVRRWSVPMRAVAATAGLTLIATIGLIDAWTTTYEDRVAKAELGRWIHDCCGRHSVVAGADEQLALVGFYAKTHIHRLVVGVAGDEIVSEIDAVGADVVLGALPPLTPNEYQAILDGRTRLGLEQATSATVPDAPPGVMLVRRPTTQLRNR
jgi:hypothetical protein